MTYLYLDKRSNIFQVVSILLDSINIKKDSKIPFAWSTNTSITMQVKLMTIVSSLNNILISG